MSSTSRANSAMPLIRRAASRTTKCGSVSAGRRKPTCARALRAWARCSTIACGNRACSTGRPGHGAATEDMAVQVRHSLAGIRTVVEHQPVARLIQPQLVRHLSSLEQQMPKDLVVLRGGLGKARDGLSGDNQDVRWGLWPDVVKGHHEVVLINDRCGDFASDDLLEQRLAHRNSSHLLHH